MPGNLIQKLQKPLILNESLIKADQDTDELLRCWCSVYYFVEKWKTRWRLCAIFQVIIAEKKIERHDDTVKVANLNETRDSIKMCLLYIFILQKHLLCIFNTEIQLESRTNTKLELNWMGCFEYIRSSNCISIAYWIINDAFWNMGSFKRLNTETFRDNSKNPTISQPIVYTYAFFGHTTSEFVHFMTSNRQDKKRKLKQWIWSTYHVNESTMFYEIKLQVIVLLGYL